MAIGEDGTGTVKGYKIGPRAQLKKAKLAGANLYDADLTGADLSFANLRGANLQFAILMEANLYGADLANANFCHANLADANMENTNLAGAYFYGARVSDRGVALIEETHKEMMESLTTDVPPDYHGEADNYGDGEADDDGGERTPNPGSSQRWTPHHDSYYDHPSVKDHVALRITPAGREHLKNSQGPSFHLIVLERLCQVPSLPQFVLESELGVSGAMLHSLSEEGLITAFIEDRPERPRDIERATEYSDDDHNLEYQHREWLRLRRTPNPGDGSIINEYLILAPKTFGGVRAAVVCNSGLSLSVVAGKYCYCEPESETGPWGTVEVGYPSRVVKELLPYAETRKTPLNTVYGYVPVGLLDEIIAKNGGISESLFS